MRLRVFRWGLSVAVVVAAAIAGERAVSVQAVPQSTGTAAQAPKPANAYDSTYQPLPSRPTVIRNATILTAAGPAIERGAILLQDGKVTAVGQTVNAPADAVSIDAGGKWVTPGIIDTHSHLGVYPSPGVESHQDGNEMIEPEHGGGLGRTFHLAAGSAIRSRAGGRRDRDAVAAGIGEPVRRPRRHGEERADAHAGGDEVPGRAVRPEDGLWRESRSACTASATRRRSTRMGNVAGYRRAWQSARRVPRPLAPLARRRHRTKRSGRIATCSSKRWPVCWTARFASITTATVLTRWPS